MTGRWFFLTVVLALATAWCPLVHAKYEKPVDSKFDGALVENLGADLLLPVRTDRDAPLDRWLLNRPGEDVGQRAPTSGDWRQKVVAPMQVAESHLTHFGDTSRASAAQQQALAGLEAMIANLTECQSQCRGGQCKKPTSPKPEKKPGKPGKRGSSPATSASAAQAAAEPIPTAAAAAADFVRDLWGHLPERQRQQILQPLREEFLPKYAPEIEAYFRAMADPDARRPARP